MLEHTFDSRGVDEMRDVEHWWNGSWGALVRRDVYLRRNPAGLWEVEVREHGRSALGEFRSEAVARTMLGQLVGEGWRRLGQASRRPSGR